MPITRPRLLVIGAGGFVGGWVVRLAGYDCDVIAGARTTVPGFESAAIDLAEPESLRAAFDLARPDTVILTAAMADIDRCQREPGLAARVNHQGAAAVARECQQCGARLVFTSTDAVFDGLAPPYAEGSLPTPVNQYGRTKTLAEQSIREILPAVVIVRPSLVLGFSVPAPAASPLTLPSPARREGVRGEPNSLPSGETPAVSANNSYLDKLAATLRAGKCVTVPTGELRNPIDVVTFARVLIELACRADAAGVFHVGASDKMSRYELARGLARELGCSPELVVGQDEPPPGRAPRGRDDFLACQRLPALTGFVVPTCHQVIERAVHGTA